MRKLKRPLLSPQTLRFLKKNRTDKVADKKTQEDKVEEAKRLWPLKNNKAFDEIRKILKKMASGNQRCMYCEDSAGTDIEHFRPKSLYPLLAFTWENYLFACSNCNSNCKRDEFPTNAKGQPLLIDPTAEEPRDHMDLSFSNGRYNHTTKKGEESIRVYGLNRETLKRGRWDAFVGVQGLIEVYGNKRKHGDMERANRIKEALCQYPYISVFIAVLDIADKEDAVHVLDPACLEVLQEFPEIRDWLVQ